MDIFQLNNVEYVYPGKIEALHDISFTISAGEQVAILGANGSGKSTLLKLLGGLYFPTKGKIQAYNQFLTEKKLNYLNQNPFAREFRSKVGFVFQNSDTQLFCPTVYDEIAFGPLQLNLPREDVIKRVEDVIDMLEIRHIQKRSPMSLSGGEKKRVAIASVLSINPDVLLLDEPTTGLDPRIQTWFEELLHTLGDLGKTIIIATHDLDIADAVTKKVIVLTENHSIAAIGTTEEILENQELLSQVNLIHEHYHHHGETWHHHEEGWHKHSHSEK
jgi:cobalt/nickel transport system ATP-binding protein